jgi:hypothetical protein
MTTNTTKQAKMEKPDRGKAASVLPPPVRSDLPHVIHPSGIYTGEDLRRIFGLRASSVRRELRLRRLRIAKRCGRYFCLGKWVQEWIENGEINRNGRGQADGVHAGQAGVRQEGS